MSRAKRKADFVLYLDSPFESQTREVLHESGYFFTKGKNGKQNGLVLSKQPVSIRSISVYDESGKELNVPWKTYYFDDDDNNKEIEIVSKDNKKHYYYYSPSRRQFIEKMDIFSYNSSIFAWLVEAMYNRLFFCIFLMFMVYLSC